MTRHPVGLIPCLKMIRLEAMGEDVNEQPSIRFQPSRNAGKKLLIVLHVLEHFHRHSAVKPAGIMASLGGNRGAAEVYGMRVTGLLAWIIWRTASRSSGASSGSAARRTPSWRGSSGRSW